MKRIIKSDSEFYQYIKDPLFTDDVYAYQIVINNVPSRTGFLINAKRADGVVITDSGTADGETLKYTLASNMHSVVGELFLRVQITGSGSTVSEKAFIFDVVKGEKGTVNSSTDQPVLNSVVIAVSDMKQEISEHILDNSNPHNVTKEQVGLFNVDNTKDIDKPLTESQRALFGSIKTKTLDEGEEVLVTGANSMIPAKVIEIFGKSVQDGTPTFDVPYDIKSVENPTVTFTYGDNVKSVTFEGITLRSVSYGRDILSIENGKVYLKQNIRSVKPTVFSGSTTIEQVKGANLAKLNSKGYSASSLIMSNIGSHEAVSAQTAEFHWYISRKDDNVHNIVCRAPSGTSWANGQEACNYVTKNGSRVFEYQYHLQSPIITEITGDAPDRVQEILDEIKGQDFSVSFSSGSQVLATGSVTYNQDLNQVIEELTNAIITLGGNV